jgi:hypothetical protein
MKGVPVSATCALTDTNNTDANGARNKGADEEGCLFQEREYLIRRHSILQAHRAQERVRTRFCLETYPHSNHLSFSHIAHGLATK